MTRAERLLTEFKACRGVFPYKDLVRLLASLGYAEKSTGGGSARKFVHMGTLNIIRFHEPHPGKEIPHYLVRQIREQLEDQGLL